MLVPARVGLALHCARCGTTGTHEVALFAFSGTRSLRLNCPCGHPQGALIRRPGRMVLQLPCYLCKGVHRLDFAGARFWSAPLQPLLCQETGLHLGVLGAPEAVRSFESPAAAGELPDPALLADFFVNAEVMYEVLAAVHELDEAGRLRCRCGNTDIDYELQPDRLELVCPECGSRHSLAATRDADAIRARRVRRMEIGGRRGHGN